MGAGGDRERTAAALRHKIISGVQSHAASFDRVGDELVPNAAEQALFERIRKEHAAGASLGSIAAKLNAEGIEGKAGGQFYASMIRKLIWP